MNANLYYIGFITIVKKEVGRFLRIWTQSILPPIITSGLYFIIFGHLIGTRIGGMNGFNYNQYIAPGLIMMAVVTNSYANVSSSFYLAKFQRNIEELLVSPLPNWIILFGYVAGGIARGIAVSIAVAICALFFTHLPIQHFFVLTFIVIIASAFLSTIGFINAIYAKNFDHIFFVPTFILTPLTYLGGVFYTINLLPKFWQHLSLANPILYMIDIFRYGMIGISDVNITLAFTTLILLTIIALSIALYLLNKGIGIKT